MMTRWKERYGITLSSQGWSVSRRPSTYCGLPTHLPSHYTPQCCQGHLKAAHMRKHYPWFSQYEIGCVIKRPVGFGICKPILPSSLGLLVIGDVQSSRQFTDKCGWTPLIGNFNPSCPAYGPYGHVLSVLKYRLFCANSSGTHIATSQISSADKYVFDSVPLCQCRGYVRHQSTQVPAAREALGLHIGCATSLFYPGKCD